MHEFDWSVILFQEFNATKKSPPEVIDGHRVFSMTVTDGSRRPAIIVKRESVEYVCGDPFFTDSSVAVFMRLPGLTPVFFISGHLDESSQRYF